MNLIVFVNYSCSVVVVIVYCFDTVGWVTGRSGHSTCESYQRSPKRSLEKPSGDLA